MKSFLLLAVLVLSVVAYSEQTTYTRSLGYFEGTKMYYWDFGTSTNNRLAGDIYDTVLRIPGTGYSDSEGVVRDEIQALLCSGFSCPDIFSNAVSSLWTTWKAIVGTIDNWTGTNDSYNSLATLSGVINDNSKSYPTSTTSYSYRKIVSSGDDLQDGEPAKTGMYAGSAVYYFDFGSDSNITNRLFKIQGGNDLFAGTGSHFVEVFTIEPPITTTAPYANWTRFTEIPVAWLSDPAITKPDGGIHEIGFNAVGPTIPGAAHAVYPAVFVTLLLALLAIVLF